MGGEGLSAYDRFMASTVMDFDKWHDGTGYNLEAIDEMTDDEKAAVVSALTASVNDWRDLEALDRIGSPKAVEAILKARESQNASLRLAAQDYGPEPSATGREEAILSGLATRDLGGGFSRAVDQAVGHPSPKVVAALLTCARDSDGPTAYGAAAALYAIYGKIKSHVGLERREFFLRFVDGRTSDHDAAFLELCTDLKLDPGQTDR